MDKLVGESIEKIFNKEEIERLAEDTKRKGFVEKREMNFFPGAQEEITVQVFTRERKDEEENTVGYFLGLFDLTEIKKREKELRNAQTALLNILEDTEKARGETEEERKKTQAIITNFTDGLLVFDAKNNLSLINPQAQAFLETPEEEALGKSMLELSQLPNFKLLVKPIEERTTREEIALKANLVLEVSVTPITEGTKASTMLLVVLHNITEKKKLEEMKVDFASIAAHELRTPLTTLRGYLSILVEEKKKD